MGEVHLASLYCWPATGTLHGSPYWQHVPLAGFFTYVSTAAQASGLLFGGGHADGALASAAGVLAGSGVVFTGGGGAVVLGVHPVVAMKAKARTRERTIGAR